MVEDFDKIRAALRDMPVPGPRPGFVDDALARATAGVRPSSATGWRDIVRRPATGWIAAAVALAAALSWVTFMPLRAVAPVSKSIVMALHESREVSLVIDSERDLSDATIRVFVSGSVGLEGFDDQSQIEWLTTLEPGANLLSLPVIARSPGDGSLVAEIEHDGRTRRVSIALRVTAPTTGQQPAATKQEDDVA